MAAVEEGGGGGREGGGGGGEGAGGEGRQSSSVAWIHKTHAHITRYSSLHSNNYTTTNLRHIHLLHTHKHYYF